MYAINQSMKAPVFQQALPAANNQWFTLSPIYQSMCCKQVDIEVCEAMIGTQHSISNAVPALQVPIIAHIRS